MTKSFDDMFKGYIDAGELRVPKYKKSGEITGLSARNDSDDWEQEFKWVKASGNATLYSFVIFHQKYYDDRPVPYNVATVELKEGPRLISKVDIKDFVDLKVGMKLKAKFNKKDGLVFVPV